MSDINFLPSEAKDNAKEEKKIRRIEFTPGERSKNSGKRAEHGGVFSIFNKKKDADEQIDITSLPPKPKDQEPQLRAHDEKKKSKEKIIHVTQVDPEKKKKPGFLARLFSRKTKPVLLKKEEEAQTEKKDADTLPPPPPPPTQDDVKNSDAEHQAFEEMVIQKHAESQQKKSVQPPPPPPAVSIQTPAATTLSQDKQEKTPGFLYSRLHKKPEIPQGPPGVTKNTSPLTTDAPQLNQLKKSMFDVNLVPDELVVRKRTMNRLTLLGLITVLALFGVGVIYGILVFYQQNVLSNAEQVEEELRRVEQQIDTLEPIQRDALVLQKRTQEIATILDSHIYWTSFFEKLSQYTLQDVTFLTVNADANGAVTLTAQAPDPAAAFEQRDVFLQATDLASNAQITLGPTIPDTTQSAVPTTTPPAGGVAVPIPSTESPLVIPMSNFTLSLTLAENLLHTPPLLLED